MLQQCKEGTLDIGKTVLFAIELNEKSCNTPALELLNAQCLCLFDKCCNEDDHIAVTACTSQCKVCIPVSLKADNQGQQ